jgi:S-adenosylmethionine decarboxylase
VPRVRRHGYLIAAVGEKTAAASPGSSPRFPVTSLRSGLQTEAVGSLAGGLLPKRDTELHPAFASSRDGITTGVQYLVDARGCEPEALRSLPRLQAFFARVLGELALTGAAAPVWHVFPGQGGITGMVLLTESHLTIHTFPECGRAAIDLYCCRRSAAWPWTERLADALGAREVAVRTIERG